MAVRGWKGAVATIAKAGVVRRLPTAAKGREDKGRLRPQIACYKEGCMHAPWPSTRKAATRGCE